ncbi:MAG: ferric reductase-like transmembrane domain-containing protein [Chloroflexi bacterium]|nr:ferric reductase-like transmembrane domain-containing protein [Chloroflexota bacterium]MDQ3401466.1 ferric reductase-like transmembrane domain-containing protein [Chloroflexota bacterium]
MTQQQADLLFWLLARASGITSFLALFIAILTGIALRTTVLGWLGTNRALKALHQFTTALWIPLGLVHLGALVVDKTARVGVADLVIPFGIDYGTGDARTAIGLGTLAFDIFIVVTITSWLRTRMEQRLWSWIHRTSYIAFGLTFVHAFLAGTDFRSPAISALSWSLAFVALVLALSRIVWGRLPA